MKMKNKIEKVHGTLVKTMETMTFYRKFSSVFNGPKPYQIKVLRSGSQANPYLYPLLLTLKI